MMDREPFIVWPAPGLPALVEAQRPCLWLVVAIAGGTSGAIESWAERLNFREAFAEAAVPAQLEAIRPLERDAAGATARGFAELPSTRNLSLVRVRVRAGAPLQPDPASPVKLYDLAVGTTVVRSRSVAVFGEARGRLALAFASDLHLASFWDLIAEAVDRHPPDLAAGLLRPTRMFDRFIAEANEFWRRGELDLVVLGGDLVEYVYDRPRWASAPGSDRTNVDLVARALHALRVPSVVVPGNHDHRAFPWRPRTYGMEAVGIPASRTRSLLKGAGLWDRWPLRVSDFDGLRTEDESGAAALAHHLVRLAPATDFALELHGTQLVFASTGCDVLARWRSVARPRWGLLARSLANCWRHPDSEGLSLDQVAGIASMLSTTQGTAVFFHAPLLNPPEGAGDEPHVESLDPGEEHDLASRAAFERRIGRGGIRRGVLFHNPGPLIRALVSAAGPVAVFSGHVHRAGAVELDRRTFAIRSVPLARPPANERTVSMLTAPAVGQLPHEGNQRPGYLLATFEEGRLTSLQRRTLDAQ